MPIPDIENNESGLSVRETLNDVIAAVNALGTAANEPTTAFATAAQGSLADSAVQPGDLGTAAYQSTTAFATAAQGSLADSAVQPGDLGNSASLNVGTTAGTVCSGDDNRLSNARTPTAHASSHVTGGTDKIRDATASQDGLMTTAYASKLNGIEAGADVTDAANVGSSISGSTTETTLADTDEIAFVTSLGALKNIAYSSLKTLLNAIYALKGVITGSGLTMSTARLLGRTTASAGAVEEISIGSGLSLSSGVLSASGSTNAGLVILSSATASNSASITFDGFFTNEYDSYLLVAEGIRAGTDNVALRVILRNAGVDMTSNYRWGFTFVPVTSGAAGNTVNQLATTGWTPLSTNIGNDINEFNSFEMLIHPRNAIWKQMNFRSVYVSTTATSWALTGGGIMESTTDATGLRIYMSTGNIDQGRFKLYGLKPTV